MLKIEEKDRDGMIALTRNLRREESLGSKQVKGLVFKRSMPFSVIPGEKRTYWVEHKYQQPQRQAVRRLLEECWSPLEQ